MTEADWDCCTDPQVMLDWLRRLGRASERKLRLFAVGCGRLLDPRQLGTAAQAAVAVAERYADGLARDDELYRAARGAQDSAYGEFYSEAHGYLEGFTENLLAASVASRPIDLAVGSVCASKGRPGHDAARSAAQAALLRDLFGPLPFRPIAIAPSWLAWNDGCAVQLALAAYNERSMPSGRLDPARLAVLADALEEAGCDNLDLLVHLRQPGAVHVRGCTVVDLLLGKS